MQAKVNATQMLDRNPEKGHGIKLYEGNADETPLSRKVVIRIRTRHAMQPHQCKVRFIFSGDLHIATSRMISRYRDFSTELATSEAGSCPIYVPGAAPFPSAATVQQNNATRVFFESA